MHTRSRLAVPSSFIVAPFLAVLPGVALRAVFEFSGVAPGTSVVSVVLCFAPELLTAALVTAAISAVASTLVDRRIAAGEAAEDAERGRDVLAIVVGALVSWPVLGALAAFSHEVVHLLGTVADSSGHGRPLRRRGRLLRASVSGVAKDGGPPSTGASLWATTNEGTLGAAAGAALREAVPEALREDVAAEWRETAIKEHAAIAAFARHALHLVAVGAPPALIASAGDALRDEVAHAALAFAVATALDGAPRGPTPFLEATTADPLPGERRAALRQIAVETLLEGAIAEGASVRLLAGLRQGAIAPLQPVLARLAREEAAHVRHAHAVLAYCLSEAPELAVDLAIAARAPARVHSSITPAGRAGKLRAYGVQAVADEEAAFATARGAAIQLAGRRQGGRVLRGEAAVR